MNTNKTLQFLFLSALCALAFGAQAQSYVGEVFVCDWVDGQGREDLMKARDYYVKQAEKAGITAPPGFIWTPVKTGPGAPELLWFNFYDSATQYGEITDAMATSEEMSDVVPRFEKVINCRSGLFDQEVVLEGGEPPVTTPPGYIVSSACNFRSGSFDAGAWADLRAHLAEVLGASDAHKSYVLFQRTSITWGPEAPDLRLYSVHDNAAAWGARRDVFPSLEGAGMLGRHFGSVMECTQSHYVGEQVVSGPES